MNNEPFIFYESKKFLWNIRKFIFSKFKNKINKNDNSKKDFIEGDFEDIEDDNDKKL